MAYFVLTERGPVPIALSANDVGATPSYDLLLLAHVPSDFDFSSSATLLMGISGLLPLLKSIQVRKHLSEFSGKTIAVDAYVWLHRGVFSCATELATGKKTHKYVDYAMHRVRLLRHHGVEPYIVFDGGPLPAKKGTESERKQRREENVARGNALASQGKHSQARDFYVKCVDVTPQMAYQLIKALKAESVSYIVAPYEADAQLAYLERVGLVDGILTEDSDLLVFGCRNVLFKLDDVSATITSISRSSFSSVSDTTTSISLIGWNDAQFRSMAILSGCDYLPSIPGIGLKTAWSLLKKYKTPEKVVQVVKMEGKKLVPQDYMEKFRLAEKCFLHQRAYDPVKCKLVHLYDVDGDWDEEADLFVGEDIEPSLAKQIAEGDADPITRLPMEDINPGYIPRVLKRIDLNRDRKGKAKAKHPETPRTKSKPPPPPSPNGTSGGILDFFGPKAIIPPQAKSPKGKTGFGMRSPKKMVVGKASGKRTLVEVMDQDLASKRARRESLKTKRPNENDVVSLSKFFSPRGCITGGGPSRIKLEQQEKENTFIFVDDDSGCEEITSECNVSTLAKGFVDQGMLMDVANGEIDDPVEQEEGYISPSPLGSPSVSSPSHSPRRRSGATCEFGVDPVSSPISPSARKKARRRRSWSCAQDVESPTHRRSRRSRSPIVDDDAVFPGPDLRTMLDGDEVSSDIDGFEDEEADISPPSPSPTTPTDTARLILDVHVRNPTALLDNIRDPGIINVDELSDDDLDDESMHSKAHQERVKAVALGWKQRWSFSSSTSTSTNSTPGSGSSTSGSAKRVMRRSETNVTPFGRYVGVEKSVRGVSKGHGTTMLARANPIPAFGARRGKRNSLNLVPHGGRG